MKALLLFGTLSLLIPTESWGRTPGHCTTVCGGVRGGCAANTRAAQVCYNKCMGTKVCPVDQPRRVPAKKTTKTR